MKSSILKNGPLVSIGVPVYNGENYLRRALDSLLSQEYKTFELIIADNASSDSTFRICREYASKDTRIRIFRHSNNIGMIPNFKFVLGKAQGKYFMWASDDDMWLPNFISTMLNNFDTSSNIGVTMCAIERIREDGTHFDNIRFLGRDDPNKLNYIQMLNRLTTPKKFNLFFYGLFNTMVLQEAAKLYPEVPGGDRLLLCQLALATKFSYVDRILHIRTYRTQPTHVRLPEESFNKIHLSDPFADFRVIMALYKIIIRSKLIPNHRKPYALVAMFRQGAWLFGSRYKNRIPKPIRPLVVSLGKKILSH